MKLTDKQEAWLQALESGEYQQTTEVLRDENGFCCLGIACDLSDTGHWVTFHNQSSYKVKETVHDNLPPLQVWRDELHLYDENASFGRCLIEKPTDFEITPGISAKSLVRANDQGATFKEIAAFIRANPEEVFTNDN